MYISKRKLHCCLIDDDTQYLESSEMFFDTNQVSVTYFSHPLEFLEFQKKYFPEVVCKIRGYTNELINKNIISNIIYGKNYPIDIVISDHHMPQINGVDLLSQSDAPCKVLLTGIDSHKNAINAFNNGIINKFYLKSEFCKNILNNILAFCREKITETLPLGQNLIFPMQCDEYYIIDSDLSVFCQDTRTIIYNQTLSDNKILNDILCESGVIVPDGCIPVVFKEQNRMDEIFFHQKISGKSSVMQCVIDNDVEIMKIMEVLGNG